MMHSEKSGKTIDLAVALAHVDGDKELLRELTAMFLDDYPRILNEAKESILHRDYSTLERVAHTLKGRLAFFGVQVARDQIVELETMGRTNELAGAWKTLTDIEDALDSVLPEFQLLSREPNS